MTEKLRSVDFKDRVVYKTRRRFETTTDSFDGRFEQVFLENQTTKIKNKTKQKQLQPKQTPLSPPPKKKPKKKKTKNQQTKKDTITPKRP